MYLCLGSEHGENIIMTDSENWKERRNQVARYRAMEQETTDPLAARLLHDIVLDLEAELEELSNDFSPS
jgi:(p)ppGpp synthase/HD superfamily hydrolase